MRAERKAFSKFPMSKSAFGDGGLAGKQRYASRGPVSLTEGDKHEHRVFFKCLQSQIKNGRSFHIRVHEKKKQNKMESNTVTDMDEQHLQLGSEKTWPQQNLEARWRVSFRAPHNRGLLPRFRTKCFQFSSVAQSCQTLWDPMDCSTPGLPVHHQLPEFIQTHVY